MELAIDSCIRGHHVSKTFWSPTLGEELSCERENGNLADPYGVAVLKDAVTVVIIGGLKLGGVLVKPPIHQI